MTGWEMLFIACQQYDSQPVHSVCARFCQLMEFEPVLG